MRPTVHDVAEAAGVSLATVDRVLNRRAGVRSETIERVETAIARLGYVRDVAAANLAKSRVYRFAFIVPEGPNSFMRGLEREIELSGLRSRLERTDIRIIKVPPFDGAALAAALNGLETADLSGVALVAAGSPAVIAALERLHRRGVEIVTLVSDIEVVSRSHYVGIDNVAAGRTAAGLLGRFVGGRAGTIALVVGSMAVRDHVERCDGFRAVIAAEYPGLDVLPPLEGRDDARTAGRLLRDTLAARDDIVGLYSVGAGNRGVIEALRDRSASLPHIAVVAHELTDHARQALADGTFDAVINQDAGHEVRSAIRVLKAKVDGLPVIDAQETIRIEIYLRDNVP
ncbi:LacI family DNA-binding transcriptional regulator [Mangrovicella endophytica]|uniref:LacI family DNA-binding transcriptional regulator n=1 Tax=Mangrovicella endophytica TaxID=2066697 RepID=UPI000C9DC266|nr:LacI family DNA-binding transcriptional regulator [Mangrovicella endophytica]